MKKTNNTYGTIDDNDILDDMFYEYISIESPHIKLIAHYEKISKKTKRYNDMVRKVQNNINISVELKKIRTELSIQTKYKYKNIIKELVNDYPYVLKKYMIENKLINFDISNAFTKLYEILHIYKSDIFNKNKKTINVYHMAEAPGQWIKCVDFYLKNNSNNIKYEWYANTLNPDNEENKKKYKLVFDDKYGLICKHKEKWLYGDDNTGDIMKIENIINIKNKLEKESFDIDLITSDAGIDVKSSDIMMLQKLDYAQLINVILLSKINTNIIIKTFLPFIMSKKDTLTNESTDFFISMIYIYVKLFNKIYFYKPMSSGVTTGEFYIIGLQYNNNITDELKTDLIYKLNNFHTNIKLIDISLIPNYIKYQIYSYLNDIILLNNNFIKLEIDFINIIRKKIITDCFLKTLHDIQKNKINYWLYKFDFFVDE
jgi:hypothetical protein